MARTSNTQYPPFSTARQSVLELSLSSRSAYIEWHKKNNITYLPRYPNRVYKEFTSWNDWLGTNNLFAPNADKKFRPYWEAVKFAQKLAAELEIDTMNGWIEWVKTNPPELPDDIPHRPDTTYKEFVGNGWNVWLGKDIRARLKTAKQNTHIFAICSFWALNVPRNHFAFVHAPNGVVEMRQKIDSAKDLVVVRAYYWEPDLAEQCMALFSRYARDEGDGHMFVPNLDQLMFELDMLLEWWRPTPQT